MSAVLLAGCGGGGSSSDSAAVSVSAFPLQAGYQARIIAGHTDNFTVSGTCTGTATITNAATSASNFEGVAGFIGQQTVTLNLTNCTPASSAVTGANYYSSNYTPLGYSLPGNEYGRFVSLPSAIPTSVKVGDTAAYSTQNTYTDSTKSLQTGQRFLSYVIESDTANTAIANLITKAYNMQGQLLYTSQSRYRIAADGTLTVISFDVQYSTTSTNHLIYTKV